VSLTNSQKESIAANQASLPALEKTAGQFNSFNIDQLTSMLNQVIPGFSDTSKKMSGDITSMLSGKLPGDVTANIENSSAANALMGGYSGSPFQGESLMKDMGVTSLSVMQQGMSTEESWTGLMDKIFSPGISDVTSMFITPQQMFQDTLANQEHQWNRDWLNNQVTWSGSLGKLAGDEINQDSQELDSLAMSVAGKFLGGMAGGAAG
jgi:hypothetical protein